MNGLTNHEDVTAHALGNCIGQILRVAVICAVAFGVIYFLWQWVAG